MQEVEKIYNQIKKINLESRKSNYLTENTYFLEDGKILSYPRKKGDNRYPYGRNGFNFWAYTSGYIHCNEGLFSIFSRVHEGQEPRVGFFLGRQSNNKIYMVIPLLPVPILYNNDNCKVKRYTVFSLQSVYYFTELEDILSVVRIYINKKKEIVFTIKLRNKTKNKIKLYQSSYINPFLRNNIMESSEDRWFREVRYLKGTEKQKSKFIIKVNEDLDRTTSISNYGIIKRLLKVSGKSRLIKTFFTTSRNEYVGGIMSSLNNPLSLYKGKLSNKKNITTFTETGVAAEILHFILESKKAIRTDIVLSHCLGKTEKKSLLKKTLNPLKIDKEIEDLEYDEIKKHQCLQIEIKKTDNTIIKPKIFNSFWVHLQKQVEFCSLIKGYVQLTPFSLIGIRDIFQALEGLLYWQPSVSKEKILEALNFIIVDGRCPRQYSLPASDTGLPKMDLRPFIDQGVWVISTIITYIKVTGDFTILDEECGYYEIIDEKSNQVRKSELHDNVLDHLFKIMDYLISNRDSKTNCIRALYGDWNDALDGLGVSKDNDKQYGSGVSVMASLQVYQNLNEMIELLINLNENSFSKKIIYYKKIKRNLKNGLTNHAIVTKKQKRRIVHGWGDKKSYYVGSYNDPDGQSRVGLTSNAFWVLSGIYNEDKSIKSSILSAYKKLDSKYGLKTFDPYFPDNISGVGRIKKLPPGTAENGATYVHATAFGIMSLFQMGESEKAWDQLIKIFPFTHNYLTVSPYIFPNSYSFNKELGIDGESMQDWQTGASNVVLKTLIKYVFGINPEYKGIWIQPASYTPFSEFEFKITIRNCQIKMKYKNENQSNRTIKVNNKTHNLVKDDILGIDKLWIPEKELSNKGLLIEIYD